jgi:uncharacterized SAM-binding protein YcdF (DUF218 family)
MLRKLILVLLCLLLVVVAVGTTAGWWLVKDDPKKSDAIVVLAGGTDYRFQKGMELLRAGYGKVLFIDAIADRKLFGHTPAEYAERYLRETGADLGGRVRVCPIREDSTISEIEWITRCVDSVGASSVLVVTSEAHTRRALSVMQSYEPGYSWSVAASRDPSEFGFKWWQHRGWAKMMLAESERMFWWQLVDRWREHPHYGARRK